MADPNRSQQHDADVHSSAVELARVAERLDGIHDDVRNLRTDVRELVKRVGEQNGRVNILEQERAARQMRSVDAARKELAVNERLDTILDKCECRMESMNDRVKDLETSRDKLTGMQVDSKIVSIDKRLGTVESAVSSTKGGLAASVDALKTGLTILALLVSIYAVVTRGGMAPRAYEPTPTAQQQGLK